MTKPAELFGRELKWVQPRAMNMEYELGTGNRVAASRVFEVPLIPLPLPRLSMKVGHL